MSTVFDLTEEVHSLSLDEEVERLVQAEALKRRGRNAKVLVQDGDLRLLLVALGEGARMPEHSVAGPALVQVMRGAMVLHAGERSWPLSAGGLLSLTPGLDHSVETSAGCVLLVAVCGGGELQHLFGQGADPSSSEQE